MKKYDVIVIGGGFAGTAAALAAAREGASVLLVEKGNCLGGAAMHSLVNPFMAMTTRINGVSTFIYRGIFGTIYNELQKRNAMAGRAFLEEELKRLLGEMVSQANVDLLFHAYLCAVEKDGDTLRSVSVATKGGVIKLEADYFIDATGDAQVAFLAECPTILGREPDHLCQPMTLCFRLGNVDVERFFESREEKKEK